MDNHHLSEAENWARMAFEADESNGTLWSLGFDYAFYAKLYKRKGDQSNAKENLKKAIAIFEECGAAGWVKKYEQKLAKL